MREILFHGKRIDNGEWVEGDLMQGVAKQKGMAWIWSEKADVPFDIFEYGVTPETVGQFTGLTDKNGKKIFEGDILRVEYSDCRGEYKTFTVALRNMTDWELMLEINYSNDVEIIGNIHDNSDLIKGVN